MKQANISYLCKHFPYQRREKLQDPEVFSLLKPIRSRAGTWHNAKNATGDGHDPPCSAWSASHLCSWLQLPAKAPEGLQVMVQETGLQPPMEETCTKF